MPPKNMKDKLAKPLKPDLMNIFMILEQTKQTEQISNLLNTF
jgi:hypothetical protein